ncbi:hypothetical protein ACC785_37960, partial [Rhizobium ruizarguesonis]
FLFATTPPNILASGKFAIMQRSLLAANTKAWFLFPPPRTLKGPFPTGLLAFSSNVFFGWMAETPPRA